MSALLSKAYPIKSNSLDDVYYLCAHITRSTLSNKHKKSLIRSVDKADDLSKTRVIYYVYRYADRSSVLGDMFVRLCVKSPVILLQMEKQAHNLFFDLLKIEDYDGTHYLSGFKKMLEAAKNEASCIQLCAYAKQIVWFAEHCNTSFKSLITPETHQIFFALLLVISKHQAQANNLHYLFNSMGGYVIALTSNSEAKPKQSEHPLSDYHDVLV